MVSKIGILSTIAILSIIGFAAAAFYANYWFTNEYSDVPSLWTEPTAIPTISTNETITPDPTKYPTGTEPELSPVISQPATDLTPSSGTTPGATTVPTPTIPRPTNTQKPLPTTAPTATPSVLLPTVTTIPQDQVIQVTSSFFDYALCNQSYQSTINQIVSNAETEIAPIQAEYDSCIAQMNVDAEACFNACPSIFDTDCTEACGQTASNTEQACENTYNSQRNPIVNQAVSDLFPYCSTIVGAE